MSQTTGVWWTYKGYCSTRSKCIDAGQEFVREGCIDYRCEKAGASWWLHVRQSGSRAPGEGGGDGRTRSP
ncbi:hypothetical protein GCM10018987_41620 [Streptomyces cremeus]